MNPALWRARKGAVVLGTLFLVAILTHNYLHPESLLDSIYWTVITVFGVGYSELPDPTLDVPRKWLTIGVILVGMMAVGYTLGMMIQAIVEGQLDRAMGERRMNKELRKLRGHVIICGYGRIGQNLTHRLARHRVPFVVIDSCAESVLDLKSHEYLHIEGDATDEEILQMAGIGRASTIVIALSCDADNVFLTLTAKNLNPDAEIIARGELPRTEKKLLQAGATQVVLPAVIGAERMADIIVRPEASNLLRCVGHESGVNAELEEFKFTADSAYVGRTVREAEEQPSTTGVMIVALKKADGEHIFNPKDDVVIETGDVAILMGPEADIEQFYETCVAPRETKRERETELV